MSGHYTGHKTFTDGTRAPLSAEEAETIWKGVEERRAHDESDMPTSTEAVKTLDRGLNRLRALGWKAAKYCPKDGQEFAVIQYGSTGIFSARYDGEWPSGNIYCCDYLGHPDGMLFKPIADLTNAERARLEECMASERAFHERVIGSLIASDGEQ